MIVRVPPPKPREPAAKRPKVDPNEVAAQIVMANPEKFNRLMVECAKRFEARKKEKENGSQ